MPTSPSAPARLNLGTTTAGTAGSTESYTVSGYGLTADILIDAPTGVELSDDGGTTWHTSLDLTETGGTVDSTTIDARIAPRPPSGASAATSPTPAPAPPSRTSRVSGTVNAVPTITDQHRHSDLGTTTAGTAGSTEILHRQRLGAHRRHPDRRARRRRALRRRRHHLEHQPRPDRDRRHGRHDHHRRPHRRLGLGREHQRRTSPTPAPAPPSRTSRVSGTVNAVPTVTVSTGSLDLGTTTAGTAGSTETYTVSGSGLTADILIDAPTGVELSDDGGTTWSTSLDLTETGGTVGHDHDRRPHQRLGRGGRPSAATSRTPAAAPPPRTSPSAGRSRPAPRRVPSSRHRRRPSTARASR